MWKYIIDTDKMDDIFLKIEEEDFPIEIKSNEFAWILVNLFDEGLIEFEE